NRALTQNLPKQAPTFFFLDIPSARTAEFDAFATTQVPSATIERVPLMRGRMVALNGVPAEQIKVADRFGWVLEGDRGITFGAEMPKDSKLISGTWWAPDHRGEALVSFDHDLATGLGLKVGDQITVNVLGRNITARLANTRKVEWRNLGINFVMLFSPNAFAGAPHTHLATLTTPALDRPPSQAEAARQDAALLRALGRGFPSVTAVRVKDALDAANELVAKLTLAIRAASGIAVASSLLVLAGALAAGQRARLYDAMILKTLGATRKRIIGAYALEYGLTGMIAAAFGVLAGTGAAWAVTTRAMNIEFAFSGMSAILIALATVTIAVTFGLVGTLRILSKKPASYLRSL
ncbi:MAG: ABC transporter permease, partial [Bosea sp. (in: a-proteobacteria)]